VTKRRPIKKGAFDSYAKIRKLTDPKKGDVIEQFEGAAKRITDILDGTDLRGRVQFKVGIGEKKHYWSLELGKKIGIGRERYDKPDVEILARATTLQKIAEGKISPIEALGTGLMRILGDLELAERFYKRLAADKGRTHPCR
jgi:hypothetical protein